ncbi:hypothetical protein KML002_24360 [Klebsiella quasipneumoniae subsp. similipneumoniae]|nr:hypothetical protein KML002_24360 [Klebsiella quasipneumoniae subsp. similipneumoniae]
MLEEIFRNGMFEYQRHWWDAGIKLRTHNMLKSRQLGNLLFRAGSADGHPDYRAKPDFPVSQ